MKKTVLTHWVVWMMLCTFPDPAWAFWDKVTSFFKISKTKSDPSLSDKKRFLENKVLPSNFHGKEGFQCVFGQETAPLTLVIYTSQACHGCAHVHTAYLPILLKKDYVQNGQLRIIIRDYPADPLSLYASAFAWQFPEHIHAIQEALFKSVLSSNSWVPHHTDHTDPKALEHALSRVKSIIEAVTHQKINSDKPSDPLVKAIFAIKMRDKEGVDVQATPYFFLHTKNAPLQTLESDVGPDLFFKWLEDHLLKP